MGFTYLALYKIHKKTIFQRSDLSIISKVIVFYIKNILKFGWFDIILKKNRSSRKN